MFKVDVKHLGGKNNQTKNNPNGSTDKLSSAISLVSKVRVACAVQVSLVDVFEAPTAVDPRIIVVFHIFG